MKKKQGLSIDVFGGCPFCGRCEHDLYIGADCWTFCPTHKVRWLSLEIGRPAQETDKRRWIENAELLGDYEILDPAFPCTLRWPGMRCIFQLLSFVNGFFFRRQRRRFHDYRDAPPLEIWGAMQVPFPDRIKWELWEVIDHYIGAEIERNSCEDDHLETEARHRFLLSIRRWLVTYVGR